MTTPTPIPTPTSTPARVRHSSAFGVPAFRRLWAAGVVSDSGDWLLFIALPLVVLQLSGSALTTSIAFLLELLPPIVLAPFVARLVARVDRKRLMVVVNVVQACCLAPLLLVETSAQLPIVYGVIVAQAACSAVFEPAKNSLLPDLVDADRIVSANAFVGLGQDIGRLVGGPLGGVLLAVGHLQLVAAADLVTYVGSAVLLATVPSVASPSVPGARRWRGRSRAAARRAATTEPDSSRAAASEAGASRASRPSPRAPRGPAAAPTTASHGILRALRAPATRGPFLVLVVASVAQGLFVVLFVFFVTDSIGGNDADVGLLRGVQAVGAIAAGGVLAVAASRFPVARVAIVGVIGFAVLTLVVWNLSYATHALWPYVVLFALVGAPGVLMGTGLTSLLQLVTPSDGRGAVFSALGLVVAVGQAVGMLLAGTLQGVVGTMPLLEVQAGAYVVAAVIAVVVLPRAARRA
jgi:MFS family permease